MSFATDIIICTRFITLCHVINNKRKYTWIIRTGVTVDVDRITSVRGRHWVGMRIQLVTDKIRSALKIGSRGVIAIE